MSIIREKLSELEILDLMAENQVIDDVVSYFDRRNDHSAIKAAIKVRYGIGIKEVQDANNPDVTLETYVKEGWNVQVNSGLIEAITVGFGQKVVGALSNLFTETGQKLSLTHDTLDGEQLEDAEKILNKHREDGKFKTTIINADKRSIQTGSSAIVASYSGGGLQYSEFVPSSVRFMYPEYVIESETGERRLPDRTDVEDCYAIVIRLSSRNLNENNFLAIMGRSTDYPNGRYVEYHQSTQATDIPKVGDSSIVSEYEYEGAPANPLSIVANGRPDEPVPEYPIAIIYGSVTDDSTPMPASTSLYEDCIEFDVASSHTLSASQEAARGCDVLSISEVGVSQPLPRTLSGAIVTNAGQELEHVSKDAKDADISFDTLKKMMVENASGWNVPDYMASSEDHMVDAESGIALEVKTRPLIKERERRINVNSDSVDRLFNIEKYLLFAHSDEDDATINTLMECEQQWSAGEIRLPENKKEMVDRLGTAMDRGLIDMIGAIKEYYGVATDTEAIAIYDKMKEREAEYPPLGASAKETPKKFGLSNGANLGLNK